MATHKVDPDLFPNIGTHLRDHFEFRDFPDLIPFTVLPKEIADRSYRYTRTPGPQDPLNFLEEGRGDCEDVTTLLCSMYASLGLETAMICVTQSGGREAHILPLLSPKEDIEIEKVCDMIKVYYYDVLNRCIGSIATHSTEEFGETIVVGSTITKYVGDLQSLIYSDYAYRTSNGWVWHHKDYVLPVEKV